MSLSLQEKFAPKSICFGCGPSNTHGLQIRSFVDSQSSMPGATICEWTAKDYHEAFPGMLNGGIIGSLLDCHSNWTAAHFLMKQGNLDSPPCTVTADFHVKLLRPTPSKAPVTLRAYVVDSKTDRATIEAELHAGGKICATCRGLFVAVKEGHPAYHRWS